jgi:hypothetical protein
MDPLLQVLLLSVPSAVVWSGVDGNAVWQTAVHQHVAAAAVVAVLVMVHTKQLLQNNIHTKMTYHL